MLGYFDACYLDCGPCGDSCVDLDPSHQAWLERQYFTNRVPSASGPLALLDDPQLCASVSAGQLVLADCANASPIELEPGGHLVVDGQCVAAADDGSVALAACANTPAQYWLLDDEGNLWSGVPVTSPMVTSYDHVRCLTATDAAGAALAAPICGLQAHTSWSLGTP
jgi:hypothetical protein